MMHDLELSDRVVAFIRSVKLRSAPGIDSQDDSQNLETKLGVVSKTGGPDFGFNID